MPGTGRSSPTGCLRYLPFEQAGSDVGSTATAKVPRRGPRGRMLQEQQFQEMCGEQAAA